jgi:predicted metal-dependent hydrolase
LPEVSATSSPSPVPAEELVYRVRRSTRARRIRVTVDPRDGVEVVLPQRARDAEAASAVVELRPWIERRLAEQRELRARFERPPGTVPYLGLDLAVVPQAGRTRVHRRADTLLVPDEPGAQRDALERWYRRAARAEIAPRADAAAAALGREVTRLTIRDQRTRWGSCTTKGALSFNWRLLLAPPEILDYVVWHEACHLVVMDHSPRFWALVAEHLPDYRGPKRWLRDNGAGLHL